MAAVVTVQRRVEAAKERLAAGPEWIEFEWEWEREWEWSGLGVDPRSAAAARGSCPCLLCLASKRLVDAASSVIPTSPGRKAPRINRADPFDP